MEVDRTLTGVSMYLTAFAVIALLIAQSVLRNNPGAAPSRFFGALLRWRTVAILVGITLTGLLIMYLFRNWTPLVDDAREPIPSIPSPEMPSIPIPDISGIPWKIIFIVMGIIVAVAIVAVLARALWRWLAPRIPVTPAAAPGRSWNMSSRTGLLLLGLTGLIVYAFAAQNSPQNSVLRPDNWSKEVTLLLAVGLIALALWWLFGNKLLTKLTIGTFALLLLNFAVPGLIFRTPAEWKVVENPCDGEWRTEVLRNTPTDFAKTSGCRVRWVIKEGRVVFQGPDGGTFGPYGKGDVVGHSNRPVARWYAENDRAIVEVRRYRE